MYKGGDSIVKNLQSCVGAGHDLFAVSGVLDSSPGPIDAALIKTLAFRHLPASHHDIAGRIADPGTIQSGWIERIDRIIPRVPIHIQPIAISDRIGLHESTKRG